MGGKLFIFALMCLIGYHWFQAWFKPEKLIEAKRKAQQRWGILSLFITPGTSLPDPVLILTARILPPLLIFWGLLIILLVE